MCFWVPKLCAGATIIKTVSGAIQYDHSVLSFNKIVLYIHDSEVWLHRKNISYSFVRCTEIKIHYLTYHKVCHDMISIQFNSRACD